jgi:hypothetical protein
MYKKPKYQLKIAAFYRVLGNDDNKRGRKRTKDETDGDEEDYEQLPRKLTSSAKKMMLPIKTKHGLIPQMIDDGKYNLSYLH